MTLDIRSQRRLHGVDPSLAKVFELAATRSPLPMQITEGRRDANRQKQLVAKGASRTMKSRHLIGNAVDFHILNQDGTANWDLENYRRVWNEAILPAAQELGVEVEWGGDWKSFKDGPHVQLKSRNGQPAQPAQGGTQMAGGGGETSLVGGASRDQLLAEAVRRGLVGKDQLQAEAQRRGLLKPTPDPRDRADVEYALAQEQGQRLPDPRDRADVEYALAQLGSQPEPKGMAQGLFDEFTSGVVGNFGDNLTAIERALPALFNDKNFMEEYQVALSEERERDAAFREENPNLAAAANIAGAVATGVGAAKRGLSLVGATTTVPGAVATGALEGGIYGAIWGAGAAEGDFDQIVEEAVRSGALGSVLGGTVSGLVQKVANGAARSAAVKALQPTAALKVARDDAYQAVSQMGVAYQSAALDRLVDGMESALKGKAFNAELHKGTAAAIQYAQSLKGKPITLTELDQLRQVVARDAGGSPVAADKTFAGDMIDAIDDFIDTVTPYASTTGQNVNNRGVATAMRSARKAHAQFKKSELIDKILLEAADQAASTGSGGNINNVIRQRFRSLLKNEKQIKYFSQEERGAMRRIVRGTSVDNTMRLIGKLSPGGNGLMTALNLGAVAVNPAMIAVSATGAGAKALADRGTQRAVRGLQTTVQSGVNSGTARAPVTAEKRAFFRTLATMLGMEELVKEPSGPRVPVPRP